MNLEFCRGYLQALRDISYKNTELATKCVEKYMSTEEKEFKFDLEREGTTEEEQLKRFHELIGDNIINNDNLFVLDKKDKVVKTLDEVKKLIE